MFLNIKILKIMKVIKKQKSDFFLFSFLIFYEIDFIYYNEIQYIQVFSSILVIKI